MKFSPKFILSLLLILALSWLNVNYFGTISTNKFPVIVNHLIHCAALLITAGIGYINWRDNKERWLLPLWLGLYAIVFSLVILVLAISWYQGGGAHHRWQIMILSLRNTFTGPLPFLVFYLLGSFIKLNLTNTTTER